MFRNQITRVLATLALAVSPLTARAQETNPTSGQEEPKKKDTEPAPPQQVPPPPVHQKNKLIVDVDETIPEFNNPLNTEQTKPYIFGNEGTFLRFNHRRHFKPKPMLTSPAPVPLEMTLTGSTRTTTVTTGFGRVAEILTGNARNDPVVTKPGLFSRTEDDEEDDSDQTPLVGPQLAYPLTADMSEWEGISWLPQGTMLFVYGKALFGSFEVFDEDSSLQLYSIGLEMRLPIYGDDAFRVDAALSAGPAYLHTGIGDAFGFEAAGGLRFEVPISGGLSFLTNVDVSLYASENVTSWGPGLSFSLSLSW